MERGINRSRPGHNLKLTARAFSLLELLVVIGLVAVLVTISSLAVGSIVNSMRLTRAVDAVQNTLRIARQTSLTRSHVVEVRFFKCASPSYQGSSPEWRALQAVEILEDGKEMPVTDIVILPQTMIMSGSKAASTILDTPLQYPGTITAPALPAITEYRRFRFLPRGTTDLAHYDPAQENWFLTIFNTQAPRDGEVPPNFATVHVEPFTGAITLYRP